ncbi:guanine nucleotide exchange factor [Anaeramoeba flamelloides]|uniref:Guanine nucleotide exchange factor n=1 Tax=Anaeramoeba flamelloides TaxID=1746091 RepID=A0AAV7ZDQ7_9EUKA|nr:guanine nucleotide exchange factor [Anaeramoeba flamelloides]
MRRKKFSPKYYQNIINNLNKNITQAKQKNQYYEFFIQTLCGNFELEKQTLQQKIIELTNLETNSQIKQIKNKVLSSENRKLKQTLKESKKKCLDLENQLGKIENKVYSSVKDKLEILIQDKNQISKEFQEFKKSSEDRETEHLKEMRNKMQLIGELQEMNLELKEKLQGSKEEKIQMLQKQKQDQQKLEQMKHENKLIQEQIKKDDKIITEKVINLINDRNQMKESLDLIQKTSKNQDFSELIKQNQILQKNNLNLSSQIRSLKYKLIESNQTIEKFKNQKNNKNENKIYLKNIQSSPKIDSHVNISKLKKRILDLKRETEDLRREVGYLNRERTASESQIRTYDSEIESLKKSIQKLEKEKTDYIKDKYLFRTQKVELQLKNKFLTFKLESKKSLKSKISNLKEMNVELKLRIFRLKNLLSFEEIEKEDLKFQIETLTKLKNFLLSQLKLSYKNRKLTENDWLEFIDSLEDIDSLDLSTTLDLIENKKKGKGKSKSKGKGNTNNNGKGNTGNNDSNSENNKKKGHEKNNNKNDEKEKEKEINKQIKKEKKIKKTIIKKDLINNSFSEDSGIEGSNLIRKRELLKLRVKVDEVIRLNHRLGSVIDYKDLLLERISRENKENEMVIRNLKANLDKLEKNYKESEMNKEMSKLNYQNCKFKIKKIEEKLKNKKIKYFKRMQLFQTTTISAPEDQIDISEQTKKIETLLEAVRKKKEIDQGILELTDPERLVFERNEKNEIAVKSATLDSLIDLLINSKFQDQNFAVIFLITFRTYTTSIYVSDKLYQHFEFSMNKKKTKDPNARQSKQISILNFIFLWIKYFFNELQLDSDLVNSLIRILDLAANGSDFENVRELGTENKKNFTQKLRNFSSNNSNFDNGNEEDKIKNSNVNNGLSSTKNNGTNNQSKTENHNDSDHNRNGNVNKNGDDNNGNSNSNSNNKTIFGIEQQIIKREFKPYLITKNTPQSILPKKLNVKVFNLLELSPVESARQLTLIEMEYFQNIQLNELLKIAWSKKDKEKRAPNVIKMIQRFNKCSIWISNCVLSNEKVSHRTAMIEQCIEIAQECKLIGNFNGIMEIISGLHRASVARLRKSWDRISKQKREAFEDLTALMGANRSYKRFRQHVKERKNKPVLPYLGVYLTDLTFIEHGNKDNTENHLINFKKQTKISKIIMKIRKFQEIPFEIRLVHQLLKFFREIESDKDEDQLYHLSLEYEPRER